jgi:ribose 1,5-bisphosphokinase PhnN
VYGSVFHRDIDEVHLKEIDEKYSKMNAVNIIITANDDVLEKRMKERGDKMIDMAGIIMVKQKYASLEGQLKTPVMYIDNSDMSVEEVVDVIVEMLKAVEEDGHINL